MRSARFPQRHRGHLTDTYRELLEGLLFFGGFDFKDPPPFSPLPPPHREQEETMNNESAKRTLISCILRQLQKMDAETLREAYAAVSRISDRGKKGY